MTATAGDSTKALAARIAGQLAGRQDRTLTYLRLAISHKLVPSPERWYGKSDPGFSPLLAPGMHRLAAAELYRIVVTPFEQSTTRLQLWAAVQRFYAKLSRLEVASELWIAGSFLSSKEEPRDVDVVVVLRAEQITALSAEKALTLDKTLRSAKGWNLDVAIMFEGDLAIRSYLQGYLSFCEDRIRPRGIAVLAFASTPLDR